MLEECIICFEQQELKKYSNECSHKFCNRCNIVMSHCPLCRKCKTISKGYFDSNTSLIRLSKFIGL